MATIEVTCTPTASGHRCDVTVRDERGATRHAVTLPPTAHPEQLVEGTFRFLLEREPKESILRSFDISVVGRYFPEYETEIRRRLNVS